LAKSELKKSQKKLYNGQCGFPENGKALNLIVFSLDQAEKMLSDFFSERRKYRVIFLVVTFDNFSSIFLLYQPPIKDKRLESGTFDQNLTTLNSICIIMCFILNKSQ